MKKLTFLLISGTILLANPCYAQVSKKHDLRSEEEISSSNPIILDCKEQTIYVAVYRLPVVCPDGYAMYDLKIKKYTSCKTVDVFNRNLANNVYKQLDENQDLADVDITCSNI